MAIGTDAAVEFFGTQDTLGTSSAAVGDGSFSIATDLSTWTNDDDAPVASVTVLANFAVAPDASSTLNLYLRLLNTVGANDAPVPDTVYRAVYVGSFPLDLVTTAQYSTLDIILPNTKSSQEYEFYIENTAGQSLPAGWDVYVTPKTIGPHA